jgi:hypothetical protein
MKDLGIGSLVDLMLLFGGLPIFFGIYEFTASSGPVTCGGKVMHTQDTCHLSRNGSGAGSKTYSEMKSDQAPSTG